MIMTLVSCQMSVYYVSLKVLFIRNSPFLTQVILLKITFCLACISAEILGCCEHQSSVSEH